MLKRYGSFVLTNILLILFDQWTKALAYGILRTNGPRILIPGVFQLYYSENRGAAFGILQGQRWFFFAVAAIVILAILFLLFRLPAGTRYLPLYAAMVLLTAGAAGNVVDRLFRGFVVDFFYFYLIDYPIFNVADCYVVVAAALFIILTCFFYKEDELSFLSGRKNQK